MKGGIEIPYNITFSARCCFVTKLARAEQIHAVNAGVEGAQVCPVKPRINITK